MEHFISSSIGSACAEILTLPICTIKTIYQTQTQTPLTPLQIITNLYQTKGIKGFFQASLPAIISQVLSTSSKYYLYHAIKDYRKTEDSNIISNSLNGGLGGLGGSLLSHPFDVWKNHLQRGQTLLNFRIKTLYSGYSGTIAKNILLYSMLFPVYDFYKLHITNPLIASIFTSVTCSLVTQPLDYYKTVLMTGNKFAGWTNPYKGYSLMISRTIPHFMISMAITDNIKVYFKAD
jgi:hypothetical protein